MEDEKRDIIKNKNDKLGESNNEYDYSGDAGA